MSEVAHRTRSFSPGDGIEHGVALVLRWLSAAVALTSILLGTLLLVDLPPGTPTYVPIVLVAVGMSVLLGSLATQKDPRSPRLRGPDASVDRAPLSPPGDVRAVVGVAKATDELGSHIPGVGSEWRILSSPASPGDETWLSWLPRERRRLGPEGGPSTTGVVRSPGQAGNLVAFPVRNYYAAAPPGSAAQPSRSAPVPLDRAGPLDERGGAHAGPHLSTANVTTGNWRAGTPTNRPFSVEELDRMFPPLAGGQRLFLEDAPLRIGRGGVHDPPVSYGALTLTPDGTPSRYAQHVSARQRAQDLPELADSYDPLNGRNDSRAGKLPEESPSTNTPSADLSLEAANPVPPHLRAQAFVERSEPSSGSRSGVVAPGARSVCASCSTVVLNLRMSGPCPRCLRPLCADCLGEALRSRGRGWCADCLSRAEAAG